MRNWFRVKLFCRHNVTYGLIEVSSVEVSTRISIACLSHSKHSLYVIIFKGLLLKQTTPLYFQAKIDLL